MVNDILVLQPGNGHWGEWYPSDGKWEMCPPHTSFVTGFRIRMESYQGTWKDDSALNSIELRCENMEGLET